MAESLFKLLAPDEGNSLLRDPTPRFACLKCEETTVIASQLDDHAAFKHRTTEYDVDYTPMSWPPLGVEFDAEESDPSLV
jgi:hypothetical protein